MTLVDPVLLSPSSRPIPDGLIATDPIAVEARACEPDYHGLAELIRRAQADRDGLIEITVEVERSFTVSRSPGGEHVGPERRCYVLRAYKVTFRDGG